MRYHPAIRVENLGKKYRLAHGSSGRGGYKTLRESLTGGVATLANRVRGKFTRETSEDFWALKDVSFDVRPGEVVGIIGRNGAGKSTLLKILSQITKPTKGRVEINGRVGSLLEVGTGFHPELTGRENVYLNGSILGMSRREIDRKFDEIVAFAEVEKFLDTPVKRYSSGMYVRLAFAVAAHLEPEILIVDEVLAVGDATFQARCIEKMRQCASSGRTILLVSHQMNSVRDLCAYAVWLDKGSIRKDGVTNSVIEAYLTEAGCNAIPGSWIDLVHATRTGAKAVRFVAAMCYGDQRDHSPEPDGRFHLSLRLHADEPLGDAIVEMQILDRFQTRLVVANTFHRGGPVRLPSGETELTFDISRLHLAAGHYLINLAVGDRSDFHDVITNALRVEVVPRFGHTIENWGEYSLVTRSFEYSVHPVSG